MKPFIVFEAAMARAKHFLALYNLLSDTRVRSVRNDWANSFKKLMHWSSRENIVRIDGKDNNSILVFREKIGIERYHFSHEYASELLRAAIVSAVSALDRYLHDSVVHYSWNLLSRNEENIPKELSKLAIPVVVTKKAIHKRVKDSNSRPGHIVKKALQEQLHREHTFQTPDAVLKATQMLGITDMWSKVASTMPGRNNREDIIETLRSIVNRRNQIVHEADLIRKTKATQLTLRNITATQTHEWLQWIEIFVKALDDVITQSVAV